MAAAIPNIGSLMTKEPCTVQASACVKEAKLVMLKHHIRHLPIMEGSKVVAVLSDRDIKLAQAVANVSNFDEERLVREICTYNPYTVHPNAKLDEVLDQMLKLHIGSALIAVGERLVGIFTVTDACRTLRDVLREKTRKSSKNDLHSELE